MGRRWVVLVALVLAACAIAIARAASSSDPNAVGPNTGIQPNGRRLAPPGKLTPIGNHPGGGALTANSHFLWTLSAGRGKNDIRIVRVQPEVKVTCKKKRVHGHKVRKCRKVLKGKVGAVVQIIPMPGVDGGIAMAADGRTAYDALHDTELALLLLRGIAEQQVIGPVRFARVSGGRLDGGPLSARAATRDAGLDSLVLTGEQSNTSLVFGESAIFKVFRRVNPGPNPITCAGTPFGGCGTSGFGREGGKAGLDEFIHVKGVGIGRL